MWKIKTIVNVYFEQVIIQNDQIERAVIHLLAHGVTLKTLDHNDMSDWKDNNGNFHKLFHEDLFSKIGRIENRPRQLRIHQLYIWLVGFQKNSLVKKKTTSLQMCIMYSIPPDGTRKIARYTIPLALEKNRGITAQY